MVKKYSLSLSIIASFILSTSFVMADIQSPIYTDDIGRAHFLGRGGYSTTTNYQAEEAYTNAVNEAANGFAKIETNVKESVNNVETDITKVIKEKPVVPAASHKSTFTYEKGKMDATNHYGMGGTNIESGVNDSKTIYKDDLGRLHFFGKANLIKE